MRRQLTQLWGAIGVASVQLRRAPSRTTLAVVAVALAVLATTLLASVGYGVLETGERQFESSGRDLWVTGGPLRFSPGGPGAIENTVTNAHPTAQAIWRHPDVNSATPIAFHAVYVGQNTTGVRLLTGVGVPKADRSLQLTQGSGFTQDDVHYANGTYAGPMTNEVIIDSRTAALFNVTVGDTLYIGGSRSAARDHEFRVVGVSPTFTRFLGTPTVAIHLSELQTLVGTTGTDRATFIVVDLFEDADPEVVKADLEREFPGYEVQTNAEQLRAIVQQNAVVIAAGVVLVALAVVAGVALVVNLVALIVYQQRRELAALRAIGLSHWTLLGLVGTQGLLLGGLGGLLGLLATPPVVSGLNHLAVSIVGFDSLLQTPVMVYGVGAGIAVGMGVVSALAAGWQLARLSPLTDLQP